MPGACCKSRKSRKKRKHTPIVGGTKGKQFGAFGSAYGAKKAGKGKPSKTPAAIWKISIEDLKSHLKEAGRKSKRKSKKG